MTYLMLLQLHFDEIQCRIPMRDIKRAKSQKTRQIRKKLKYKRETKRKGLDSSYYYDNNNHNYYYYYFINV